MGKGFLGLVDNIFWHLPFVSPKQAHAVREKANPPVTEEDWAERLEIIKAEHAADGAREQLAAGWKSWLAAKDPAAEISQHMQKYAENMREYAKYMQKICENMHIYAIIMQKYAEISNKYADIC